MDKQTNLQIRYGCAKVLMGLSKQYPEKLYLYMDSFIEMLDSDYRILTWNAMAIMANLTRVDTQKKFDAIFDKYYSFPEVVLNAIKQLGLNEEEERRSNQNTVNRSDLYDTFY